METRREITVVGAGILGLWQALRLARGGHRVTLVEEAGTPFERSASQHAGVMLAPDCEAEAAPALVREHGHEGLALWRATYPDLVNAGTLVLASARDQTELTRFARATTGYRDIGNSEIATLEPDIGRRFSRALFFADEAHMSTPHALAFLLNAVRETGVETRFGATWDHSSARGDLVIDCRGVAARDELKNLRGVRGERLLIGTPEIGLARPVRVLHPRHPLYVVPWGDGRFLIGATMIESEDAGPITVRSALELLATAYALHPAFGEAEILEAAAGVRPAFPDNVPRAVLCEGGRRIMVNGAYRHGFLLAPVLAEAVASYLDSKAPHPLLIDEAGKPGRP